ncbi:MAG: tetratricopeptide repeat protein [Myxococcota bacterium]|nr:tetratricopeptide repeat protein [Myxococcota bacterium]
MPLERDQLIDEALRAIERGQHDRAARAYQRVVQQWPDDLRAWLKLAEIHLRSGAIERAIDVYQHLARHYEETNNWRQARSIYLQLQRLAPDRRALYQALLDVELKLDAPERAQEVLAQLLQRSNDTERSEALVAYAMSDAAWAALRFECAAIAVARDDQRLAEQVLREQLRRSALHQEHDDALVAIEELLHLLPADRGLLHQRCFHQLKRGEAHLALNTLQTLMRQERQDPETLALLGDTLELLGHKSRAIDAWRQSAQRRELQGDEERALALWRKIYDRDPGDQEALQSLERLRLADLQRRRDDQLWADAQLYHKYGLAAHALDVLSVLLPRRSEDRAALELFIRVSRELGEAELSLTGELALLEVLGMTSHAEGEALYHQLLQSYPSEPRIIQLAEELGYAKVILEAPDKSTPLTQDGHDLSPGAAESETGAEAPNFTSQPTRDDAPAPEASSEVSSEVETSSAPAYTKESVQALEPELSSQSSAAVESEAEPGSEPVRQAGEEAEFISEPENILGAEIESKNGAETEDESGLDSAGELESKVESRVAFEEALDTESEAEHSPQLKLGSRPDLEAETVAGVESGPDSESEPALDADVGVEGEIALAHKRGALPALTMETEIASKNDEVATLAPVTEAESASSLEDRVEQDAIPAEDPVRIASAPEHPVASEEPIEPSLQVVSEPNEELASGAQLCPTEDQGSSAPLDDKKKGSSRIFGLFKGLQSKLQSRAKERGDWSLGDFEIPVVTPSPMDSRFSRAVNEEVINAAAEREADRARRLEGAAGEATEVAPPSEEESLEIALLREEGAGSDFDTLIPAVEPTPVELPFKPLFPMLKLKPPTEADKAHEVIAETTSASASDESQSPEKAATPLVEVPAVIEESLKAPEQTGNEGLQSQNSFIPAPIPIEKARKRRESTSAPPLFGSASRSADEFSALSSLLPGGEVNLADQDAIEPSVEERAQADLPEQADDVLGTEDREQIDDRPEASIEGALEAGAEADPAPDAEAEADPAPDAEAEADPAPEVEAEADPAPEVEAEADPAPGAEAEPQLVPQSEPPSVEASYVSSGTEQASDESATVRDGEELQGALSLQGSDEGLLKQDPLLIDGTASIGEASTEEELPEAAEPGSLGGEAEEVEEAIQIEEASDLDDSIDDFLDGALDLLHESAVDSASTALSEEGIDALLDDFESETEVHGEGEALEEDILGEVEAIFDALGGDEGELILEELREHEGENERVIDPTFSERQTLFDLARGFYEMGNWRRALATLDQAKALSNEPLPINAQLLYLSCRSMTGQTPLDESEAQLNQLHQEIQKLSVGTLRQTLGLELEALRARLTALSQSDAVHRDIESEVD